ncbi:B-cadherin isoform X2 [Eucyclogobius newberryi]|uniref:B-cadherin isoform X2 n=1 Tax=Eucyclogobius newberryi TaxID=166745 RepID=UPI003B5A2B0D
MVKIKTSKDAAVEINYRIKGPGADEPPEGLFTVERRSGVLQVTQPLDREKRDTYNLWVHAVHAHDGSKAEEPMELIIHVIDLNDNHPEFTLSSSYGNVSESAKTGDFVMRVTATDRDDPQTDHAMIKYRILSQTPEVPSDYTFAINPLSGVVSLTGGGLDRETHSEYKLIIQAADMNGAGLSTTCTATVTITDSNDNAPQFTIKSAFATIPENEAGVEVFRFQVTDEDELGSANANTKYAIVKGNEGVHFKISTGPDRMQGILSTLKKLDFESTSTFTLLVAVTNEAAFTRPVSTSTATIAVKVEDKNEPPMFAPSKIQVSLSEDAQVGSSVTYLRAVDPDTARRTKIRFKLNTDAAGWFHLDPDTGRVSVRSDMDRESHFVRDNKYSVLVLAYDNDTVPATGTGTLLVTLLDVNDNAPVIQQRKVSVCSVDPDPVQLDIVDPDSPGNAGPFTVELQREHFKSWNIKTNSSSHAVFLSPTRRMLPGRSSVLLRVYDTGSVFQDSSLQVEVCECEGAMTTCSLPRSEPLHRRLSYVSLVLGAIFTLLLLLLLVILIRRRKHIDNVALLKDESRDNIFCYDEEGGGEEDRDFDRSLLQRGLNEQQEVVFTEVVSADHARPNDQPQPNEDIGQFISENLLAADADSSAPLYDSLLVFDFEGAGSEAYSLSSLDSSDSELDQDFGGLQDWGPRFSRLADMYTTGVEDDADILPGKTEWV